MSLQNYCGHGFPKNRRETRWQVKKNIIRQRKSSRSPDFSRLPDVSASVYKHLTEEEIEKLTLEISGVRKVDNETKERVLTEFHHIALAQDYITQGGIGYAKMVLEKALGRNRRHPSSTG